MATNALIDVRDELDLVVQACSVQAWSDAFQLANESVLDESNLRKAFKDHTPNSSSSSQDAAADTEKLVVHGITVLREKLKGTTSLPTEDAMTVMKLGTTTRTAIDIYLGITGSE